MRYLYIINTINFERIHYAFCMATSGAALNNKVTIFFASKSVEVLQRKNKFLNLQGNNTKSAESINNEFYLNKVATIEELIKASIDLKIKFFYCSMIKETFNQNNLINDVCIEISNLSKIYSTKYKTAKIIYI